MPSDRKEQHRWQELGSKEPYWTVCTEERFRANSLTERDRADFFASGEREVAATFEAIERLSGKSFRPGVSLDYGCGVGRLVLPIARRSGRAIGVDISEAMLAEARANAERLEISNVLFQTPNDALGVSEADLDFLHSYIVFQHIEPAVGLEITKALLRRLRAGGVGSLHYTFRRNASRMRRLSHVLRKRLPGFNSLINAAQGKPLSEPMIPVHEYDRDELLEVFDQSRCHVVKTVSTDHAGLEGSVFFFVKQ